MSTKINHVDLKNMKADEHMGFHVENDALIVECGAAKINLAAEYPPYKTALDEEDEALKKIPKSDYTRLIKEADHERDGIFGGMVLANKANAKHYTPEIKAAATRIQILLDTFGNLSKKPLNEQTNAIHNILQELRGKYAGDVTTTGIGGWADELERTNNKVILLVKERADETVEKTTIALKDARVKLDAAYKVIVERINALVVVEGDANYERYVKGLNEIIHRYMQAVKTRAGRNAKKREGAEAESEPKD